MAKKILTLNIGASEIELAEYETGGRSARLVNYGTAQLAAPLDSGDPETILVPALMEIVRTKGIRPGKVAVSLSGQMVFPRFAAIAAAGGADRFEQLVRYEVEQNIPFPIDEMVCDHQVLGETESGDKAVLIVAAKVEQVEALTTALTAAGFSPEIVGVAPFAVTNLFLAGPGNDGSCAVVLDIGAKTTSLVIVEGEKIYNRSIPVAGNAITKDIAQALGCTIEEAEAYKCENAYVSMGGVMEDEDETLDRISKVCRAVMTRLHAEISRSINFYRSQQGGSVPSKLWLTGGSSVIPQLAEFFQDSLQIEVEYLNPFAVVSAGSGVDAGALEADASKLAATAGLALQAAGSGAINLNLMPQSILDAKAEAARIPFVGIGAAGLVAAAVIAWMSASSAAQKVMDRIEPAQRAAATVQKIKSDCDKAKKDFEQAKKDADALCGQLARRDWTLLKVKTVRAAIPSGFWISSWQDKEEKTVVEEEPQSRRRGKKAKPAETVRRYSSVTFRCWPEPGKGQTDIIRPLIDALEATGFCKCSVSKNDKVSMDFGTPPRLRQCTIQIEFKEGGEER
ncbi:MAG: type IV pilus assembly protein PilM [Kiritimatiellae bacterium]|nr:type IV pilus assembly protein PilM [Kiritimatiellia bacterium]